ncbi:MAG: STY4526/YPO1902 family pathogenicity island replication protein [Panacagrimonas sp.]
MNTAPVIRERSKENDLTFAVLNYASRCVAEGDFHAFRGLGFQIEDIGVIERLSLAELQLLSTSRSHAINVSLDREAWGWLLKRVRRQRSRDALALALIRLDAPNAMMASLFSYTDRDYASRREACGIKETLAGGRPPSASEDDERHLWDLWVRLAKADTPQQLRADDLWLVVAKEGRPPVRTAWNLIQKWAHGRHEVMAWQRDRATLSPDEIRRTEVDLRERHGVRLLEDGS